MPNDDDAAPAEDSQSRRAGRWSRAGNVDGAGAEQPGGQGRADRPADQQQPVRRADGYRPKSVGEGWARSRDGRAGGYQGRGGGSSRSGGDRAGRDASGGGRPDRAGSRGRRDDSRGGAGRERRAGSRNDRGGAGARSPRDSFERGAERDDRPGDRGIRGPRAWDRSSPSAKSTRDTRVEPPLPEDITGKELDRSVWRELRTLTKENAEGVAKHLVAAATVLEEDPDLALAHAEHAARRAGRVAAVREALGLVHYRRGEYGDAIREFRTAKRLSGSNHLLPYLVDCERGLGRYERALDLAASPEARSLGEADNIELAIVVSGVRRDLGQPEAAQMVLRIPALERGGSQPWAARLFYAYAEALLAAGDEAGAREWFVKAANADADGETDATDRLDEIDGVVLTDLLGDAEDPEFSTDEDPAADDGSAPSVADDTATVQDDGDPR
ncbi:hypothetical protein [Flexivirga caeni]|uniref:hypothetical protein n=1 Tax=Flexivirga caeni TaxID=2294115 RepID=UPI0015E89549|nr:hypothetical protein [Flexivirga caeni]